LTLNAATLLGEKVAFCFWINPPRPDYTDCVFKIGTTFKQMYAEYREGQLNNSFGERYVFQWDILNTEILTTIKERHFLLKPFIKVAFIIVF